MADTKTSALNTLDDTTIVDADKVPVVDTSATETKAITWANIKTAIATYLRALANTWSAIQTFNHGMFKLRDTANDHNILIQAGADEAADRTLSLQAMGGNKTLPFLEFQGQVWTGQQIINENGVTGYPLVLKYNNSIVAEFVYFGWAVNAASRYMWGNSFEGIQTQLTSPTAGVVNVGNSSGLLGWLQQTGARRRLASAVTNVSTTFANLTDLTLTLIAGRKYTGLICLPINNALAADGWKFDLNGGTATFTSLHFGIESLVGATIGTRTSTAVDTPLTVTALADTSDVYAVIRFTAVVNAGGTLIPRQAKNADGAGATLTHRLGGYLWLEDTP